MAILVTRPHPDNEATAAVLRARGHEVLLAPVLKFEPVAFRDEGGRLSALELEHYPAMAEAEIARIAARAMERWPLNGVSVIHRYGRLAPGDNIVLVVTASTHRHAAFDAASFLMDYLKSRAPFWKKEHPNDGGDGGWVDAREDDEIAARRWERG